ncbi:MAG: hypothetical protein IIU16_04190 [Bacteroidales bacterium]|nr:hypothetical protein [Bacteroidales bacterium]
MPVLADAQSIPARLEISQIEANDGQVQLEAFQFIKDGEKSYWLSVGHLGVGDEIVQVQFDPLFELFIPLGDTLEEAIGTMEKMKEYYDKSSDNSFEVEGCLAVGFPTKDLQTVTIVPRRVFLTRNLIFKLEYDGYERNTYVPRSNFVSILSGLKFYQKLHPNEE